jgi:YVTN family beta-propeller protein
MLKWTARAIQLYCLLRSDARFRQSSRRVAQPSVWLPVSVVCLLVLLGMALLAIPAQAQPFAYVANRNSNSVSVINTASNTVVATVGVGACPAGVAITPDGTRACSCTPTAKAWTPWWHVSY